MDGEDWDLIAEREKLGGFLGVYAGIARVFSFLVVRAELWWVHVVLTWKFDDRWTLIEVAGDSD